MFDLCDLPTKPGTQFIAIWEYEGEIWSETLKINRDREFLHYDNRSDDFMLPLNGYKFPWEEQPNIRAIFIRLSEDNIEIEKNH